MALVVVSILLTILTVSLAQRIALQKSRSQGARMLATALLPLAVLPARRNGGDRA